MALQLEITNHWKLNGCMVIGNSLYANSPLAAASCFSSVFLYISSSYWDQNATSHPFFLFIHLNQPESEKRKQPKCSAYLFLIVLYNFNQINGSGWLPHQQVFAGPLLIPLIYSLVICEIKAFEGSNQNLLIINHKKVVSFITCKC